MEPLYDVNACPLVREILPVGLFFAFQEHVVLPVQCQAIYPPSKGMQHHQASSDQAKSSVEGPVQHPWSRFKTISQALLGLS